MVVLGMLLGVQALEMFFSSTVLPELAAGPRPWRTGWPAGSPVGQRRPPARHSRGPPAPASSSDRCWPPLGLLMRTLRSAAGSPTLGLPVPRWAPHHRQGDHDKPRHQRVSVNALEGSRPRGVVLL